MEPAAGSPANDTGSPTPEALLGVLGKLRRTLSKNVAGQKPFADTGLIKAADVPGSRPNLLRPSPGLESVSSKEQLSSDRLLEAPDLESAAPPVELDRPSRPQPADEDRAEPQQPQPEPASPVLTLLGPALPGAAPDDTPVTGDLQSPSQQSPVPEPVSQATYYAFENNPSPQALSLGIADTTSPHQEGQSHSSDVSNAALAAKPTEQTSPKLAAADGDVETSLLSTADGHALSGKADKAGPSPSFPRSLATTSESGIVTQDSALALASIAESGEGEDTQHDGQVRSAGAMADSKAQVEEDLDKVIQELSMEVSQLQPTADPKQAQQAQAGSYLQRHTSSVVLKIAQDASSVPLPAAATKATPKAQLEVASAQPVPTRHVRKPQQAQQAQQAQQSSAQQVSARPVSKSQQAQQAQQALRSMAESLKRAYDEGRLKERSPVGNTGQQAAGDYSGPTLRTYKPSPRNMMDLSPTPAQPHPSPNANARSSSYVMLRASMRRSISPRQAGHALPLDKRPAWDTSPVPRCTSQRAQHALEDSNADAAEAAISLQQGSAMEQLAGAVSAGRAEQGSTMEQIGSLKVSSQVPGASTLSPAEQAQQAVAALLDMQKLTGRSHLSHSQRALQTLATAGASHDQARPQDAASHSKLTGAPSGAAAQGTEQHSALLAAPRMSEISSQVGVSGSGSGVSSSGIGRTSSKIDRTSSGRELVQPAWVSSSSRSSASHTQSSPLRRSTGSRPIGTTPSRPSPTALLRDCPRSAHGDPSQSAIHPSSWQGCDTDPGTGEALLAAAEQLDARSPSLAANIKADAHDLAHAQALQRLQQAVQDYKSSSANVLVPAAVQLAVALRRAAKGSGDAIPTIESLQLAGLRLQHEAGASVDEGMPKSPWPDWVRGAWGSPSHKGAPPGGPTSPQRQHQAPSSTAQGARHAGVASPQSRAHLQHTAAKKSNGVQLRPAQQAEHAESASQVGLRNPPQSNPQMPTDVWSPVKGSNPGPARRSTLVQRALSEAAAAAAADWGSQKSRARMTISPPRRAAALPSRQGPALAVPTAGHAAAWHLASGGEQLKKTPSRKITKASSTAKASRKQAPPSTAVVQVQPEPAAPGMRAVEQPAPSQHMATPEIAAAPHTHVSASDTHTALPAQAGVPAHSSTSVAALRKTFEQQACPVDSLKPRNRLPLRKVSSKAHVPDDDASPQQAALAWQQSLRDEHDAADIHEHQPHALHTAKHHHHAEHPEHSRDDMADARGFPGVSSFPLGQPGSVRAPSSSKSNLMHTMSSVVSQREVAKEAAAAGPGPRRVFERAAQQSTAQRAGHGCAADQTARLSPAQQAGQVNLTEAALAAVSPERSSAEKLPVSHRLSVTRSTFDSDQGSLVSMDSDGEEAEHKGPIPGLSSNELVEEPTLSLLPDRGMSPVSEASEERLHVGLAEGRVASWKGLRWAHGPSWVRVVARLAPSPYPHFLRPQEPHHSSPQGPHSLHADLGRRGADAKQFTFDEVLAADSSPDEVVSEAQGLVQAVLQGHNGVALALGQSGSGKTFTMAGDIGPLDRTRTRHTGLAQALVDELFSQIEQDQEERVQSVHVTAFQIMDERISDLLQAPPPVAGCRHLQRSGSQSDKHDIFVDKDKRTWVSNLAALQIMSSSDFSDAAELIASRRYSSNRAESVSHGPSSCVITLLVTCDVPHGSADAGHLPHSANRKIGSSPSGAAAVSTSAGTFAAEMQQWQGSPRQWLQSGAQAAHVTGMSRRCVKLTFVEVGCSASHQQQGHRRATAEPMQTLSKDHLARTSTNISSFCSLGSSAGGRMGAPSTTGPWGRRLLGSSRGAQDTSMRAVAEVVWAAAHGQGIPVPHRQSKLTRYLQDTLKPSGRAVALMCLDPAASSQGPSMATLAAAERMMQP